MVEQYQEFMAVIQNVMISFAGNKISTGALLFENSKKNIRKNTKNSCKKNEK